MKIKYSVAKRLLKQGYTRENFKELTFIGADLQGANMQNAYMKGVDMQGANMRGANMQNADLQGANMQNAYMKGANMQGANMRGADMKGVDMQGTDMRGADMRGVNLDYSSFPLSCGGSNFKCDTELVYQFLDHICSWNFPKKEELVQALKNCNFYANSHRATDLGLRMEEYISEK